MHALRVNCVDPKWLKNILHFNRKQNCVIAFSIEMQKHFDWFFSFSFPRSLIFFCIRWFNGCKKGRMQISNGNARKCEYLLHRWYAFVCHSKTKATWSHYSVDSPKFVSTLARCDATHYVHFHSVQCSHTCTHGPRNTEPNETDSTREKERENELNE